MKAAFDIFKLFFFNNSPRAGTSGALGRASREMRLLTPVTAATGLNV